MLSFLTTSLKGIASTIGRSVSPGGNELVQMAWSGDMDSDKLLSITKSNQSLNFFRNSAEYNIEVKAGKSIAFYPVIASNAIGSDTITVMSKTIERRAIDMIRIILSNKDVIKTSATSKEEIIDQFRGSLLGNPSNEFPEFRSRKESVKVNMARTELRKLLRESGADVEVLLTIADKGGKIAGNQCKPITESIKLSALDLMPTSFATKLTEAKDDKADDKAKQNNYKDKMRAAAREADNIAKAVKDQVKDMAKQARKDGNHFKDVAGMRAKYGDYLNSQLKADDEAKTKQDRYNEKMADKQDRLDDEQRKRNQTIGDNNAKIKAKGFTLDNKSIEKINELEPTTAVVSIYYESEGGTYQETQLILAVKASLHVLPSAAIVSEISRVISTERPFFRFIQWYTGEIGFWKDFVLNVDQVSSYFTNDRTDTSGMFSQLLHNAKSARQINSVKSVSNKEGARLIPTTSILLTVDEVKSIQRSSQEDLMASGTAKRFIDTMGIMNLYIVDEPSNILYKYNHTTMKLDRSSIPSEDKKNKDNDQMLKTLSMALQKR